MAHGRALKDRWSARGIGGLEEFLVEAFDAGLDVAEPRRLRRSTVKAASVKDKVEREARSTMARS
jgi:hypothetical protein